jgi:radical SAM protein with 4Fe4S-binding SPASM domain
MSGKDKPDGECEEFEKEVDLDTVFSFPQVITECIVLGKHLIIAPEQANWLVCDDEEYEAFRLFKDGKNIQEVEELLKKQQQKNVREVVSRLVAQIYGKEFLQGVKIREKPTFKAASLHLTAGCNLRCTTCLWSATVAGPDECSLDHWKRFLGAYKSFGGQIVVLTGGEPMTNADCLEVMQYGKQLGLKVILLTNGTLVTKENAKILGDNCSEVRISIDGPTMETHDSVRGKGVFAKTLSALKELSVHPQCHLSISMTPTPETLASFRTDLGQFARWVWQEISLDISFRLTRKLMEGRELPCMSKPEELAFRDAVVAICDDQLESNFIHKLDAANIIPNRRIFGCGLADIFSVRSNGDIRLCAYSTNPFGNIKDMADGKAFLLDLSERLGQLIRSTRVEDLIPCKDCDLRYFCGGKCRKDNEDDFGSPNICECDWNDKKEWY